MQTQNLWGNIDIDRELPDPVRVLQQQASLLEDLTGGELEGRIRRRMSHSLDEGGAFRVSLAILAPYLENYSVDIIDATYPPPVYPIMLVNMITMEQHVCNSEDQFIEKLGDILRSKRVQDYISALIAHSRREKLHNPSRQAPYSDYR